MVILRIEGVEIFMELDIGVVVLIIFKVNVEMYFKKYNFFYINVKLKIYSGEEI